MKNVPGRFRAGAGDPLTMQDDYGTQPSEMSIRDYIDLLRRRKAIIIQAFIVVVSVGLVITMMSKPVYQSVGSILVEGRKWGIPATETQGIFAGLYPSDSGHGVDTQIVVITGRNVVDRASEMAGVRPGLVRVRADQVGQTDVVNIIVESADKKAALKVAQKMPEAYAEHVNSTKRDQLNKMYDFAKKELAKERDKLANAEASMQDFKRVYMDVDFIMKARMDQAAKADADIMTLRADIAAAKASLDNSEAALKKELAFIETPLETSNNATIEQMRGQISTLENERAAESFRFKDTHPVIKQLDARIDDLKKRLAQLPRTIRSVTRQPNPAIPSYQAKVAEARGAYIAKQAQLDRMLSERQPGMNSELSAAQRKYAGLQREVEGHVQAVLSMSRSVDDLDMRRIGEYRPVTVISPAMGAGQIAPKPTNNFITAAAVGLMLGICLALLQEYLDDRINSPEDARRLLDAPVLGYVPLVDDPTSRLLHRAGGGGSLLESYRVMRSNVQFATVDAPTSSIVITSTSPGEGKSVTATNLAIAMALDGRKVILVDADLRRPTLHEKLDADHRPGLTNVLVGRATLDEALKDTSIPGLRLLASGPLPPNPAEILNSRAMAQLHEALREMADVVIFDSPPFLATADAQVLSSLADGVIYVVQLGEAKKSPVKHSSELLRP